jgi:alpha-1,2-glucosyltransferase
VSLLLKPIAGCETSSLRVLNVGAIALICLVVYQILGRLRKPMSNDLDTGKPGLKQRQTPPKDWNSILGAHSALNVALFPPLFFFSALYYTDVMSTLAVLLSYYAFLIRNNTENHLRYHIWTVSVGVLALLFRQTNVFWVAVFPAGLAVVRVLGNTHKTAAQAPKNAQAIVESAWVQGRVHDIPVEDAGPQGM